MCQTLPRQQRLRRKLNKVIRFFSMLRPVFLEGLTLIFRRSKRIQHSSFYHWICSVEPWDSTRNPAAPLDNAKIERIDVGPYTCFRCPTGTFLNSRHLKGHFRWTDRNGKLKDRGSSIGSPAPTVPEEISLKSHWTIVKQETIGTNSAVPDGGRVWGLVWGTRRDVVVIGRFGANECGVARIASFRVEMCLNSGNSLPPSGRGGRIFFRHSVAHCLGNRLRAHKS